jgi:hypothetical protein
MIKLQKYTPEIYYKESRDFQFLGRLFDIVLNSTKTEADLLYSIPLSDTSNDKLLELFALTVGFKANKKYNSKQLRAICKVFPEIMKHKGSIKAIQIACNSLFSANSSAQTLSYDFESENEKTSLNLYVPQDFEDIPLLTNILSYVLPAGMSCNIIKELQLKTTSVTELSVDDIPELYNSGEAKPVNGTNNYLYNNNLLAAIPQFKETTDKTKGTLAPIDAIQSNIKDNFGFIANNSIFKPTNNIEFDILSKSTEEEEPTNG